MKKLLYVLTGLCLLAGLFVGCEKPEKESDDPNEGGGGTTPTEQTDLRIVNEDNEDIEELECDAPECAFKLTNTGNIAREWLVETETEADWITEITPKSGTLSADDAQTITFKRKLQEEDKETVITIKTDEGNLQLKIINKGFVMEMVYVEGGTFEMGATEEQGDDASALEKPVHSVTLDGYHIGKYEVTRAQWKAVMGKVPAGWRGDDLPVAAVSWNDAQEFCKKLSEATGRQYVLPTEAQWEYAARGGNKSQHYKYSGSNDIDEVAWYGDNSDKTHPVGTKKANELGIYDMTGNVCEWCSDWFFPYRSSPVVNPQGPPEGTYRMLRGGNFQRGDVDCRVSFRYYERPDCGNILNYGFRIACLAE